MQMHGYLHGAHPFEFGMSSEAHQRAHERSQPAVRADMTISRPAACLAGDARWCSRLPRRPRSRTSRSRLGQPGARARTRHACARCEPLADQAAGGGGTRQADRGRQGRRLVEGRRRRDGRAETVQGPPHRVGRRVRASTRGRQVEGDALCLLHVGRALPGGELHRQGAVRVDLRGVVHSAPRRYRTALTNRAVRP